MNEVINEIPGKSPKQLEKESKKLAKLEKFRQKQKQNVIKENVHSNKKKEKKKEVTKPVLEYNEETLPGQKKCVSNSLPDSYSPKYVEAAWYAWWEKEGFFKPEYGRNSLMENSLEEKFVMIIPPPNVTGTLHIGHALTNSIEDAITRWNRMKGRITLWNPGCDHAGIATQVVVEKKLWQESKISRHDIGREKFIKKIWDWKNEKGDRICTQLRKLGSSLDWDRECFTMDSKLSKAVIEAFVRLHDSGDIYRSTRLVNWSCTLKSAISDIEVDKIEISGPTGFNVPGYNEEILFGVLIYFAYEIENVNSNNEYIVVATTRVETMLGDSAIAVHPDDDRYKHLHNKYVKHPFCNRKLPVICDHFVDKEFGTGAVKITPAHDPNDYEIGKRHHLPFITIFSDDGYIIGEYGIFTGMKRFEARKAILEALKEKNLYRETKNNPMVVPVCSRSKDIVEPLIKPQWYVKCDEMAKKAIDAVETKKLKIIPENHIKTWYHWMENIRDWCISRQLWWGHRIPAYEVFIDDSEIKKKPEIKDCWVSGRSEDEAKEKAAKKFNIEVEKISLKQDSDVLDTWFSSGLFPFSVFGWPDNTEDLKIFFPNTLLETGHDILFFWVARMVFLSQKLLGKLPFKTVFLHPMVRDAHGRKMSKSLGNVIDPMDVIEGITLEKLHEQLMTSNLDAREIQKAKNGQKQDYPNGIPECGTDALRFALCSYMSQARDINLDILRVQGYRFFCNKLWNAVKFALMYFPNNFKQNNIDNVSDIIEITSKINGVNNEDEDAVLNIVEKYCTRFKKNSISNENILSILNSHFANFSFLKGYVFSKYDFKLLKYLRHSGGDTKININLYPYLYRWKRHVSFHENVFYNKLLGPMNMWILSRLAVAVDTCNNSFENFDFNTATTACYNLWLYEICDVYLESLKPVFASQNEDIKQISQQTLLKVLDSGLRLLSPFMPFITEELYQRLPLKNPSRSICIAPYPETEEYVKWRNQNIENEVQFVQKLVHCLRSAKANYNITKNVKPEVFICCSDDVISSYLKNYLVEIRTLSYCGEIFLNNSAPDGCVILTVSDKCIIHLRIKGLIDLSKELERLTKSEVDIMQNIQKLEKSMNSSNYSTKVPLEVQTANIEKLKQINGELLQIVAAKEALTDILREPIS